MTEQAGRSRIRDLLPQGRSSGFKCLVKPLKGFKQEGMITQLKML